MKIHNIPLAIILKKTQNGYLFESLQDLSISKQNNKKSKLGRRPAVTKAPNRLIKQIGLSNQQILSQVTPEPQPLPHVQQEPQQNPPIQIHNEEQQISYEIDRENIFSKSPATWFDKQRIHDIQRKQMSEFFIKKQGKTPEIYMKYRNFIIEAFQRNPKRYLTKISCRRILRGDVNSIMRIHTFLQKHGIINFGIDYQGNYNFKSTALFKQTQQKIRPQTCIKSIPQNDEQTAEKQIDVDNITVTPINKNFSRSYRANCSICKLVCGVLWFANIAESQTTQNNICFQCFQNTQKQEKTKYHRVDIIKSMQLHGKQGKTFLKQAWSVQENLKLLDFMSSSQNNNWKKLLQVLGGKRTIQDVILQFLQFPVSNINLLKYRRQLQQQIKQKNSYQQIGFDSQDYFKILQSFFQSSSYNKKQKQCKTQISDQNQKLKSQNILIDDNKQILGIKNIISLTNERILTKIEYLKQRQKIVQIQLGKLQTMIPYRNNIHTLREDQPQYLLINDQQQKNIKHSSSEYLINQQQEDQQAQEDNY